MLTTYAIDALRKANGQIVVVSSLAGHVGVPNTALYSSSKHALHGFFNSLVYHFSLNYYMYNIIIKLIYIISLLKTQRIELKLMNIENVGITICAIGATDTEGAREVQKNFGSLVKWVKHF
jgi:short-subunit dehydrogenase involved in D-alanine esterification of teichoic acids